MTILNPVLPSRQTKARIWGMNKYYPSVTEIPQAPRTRDDVTSAFERLIETYRLAYAYGYEEDSEEATALASRLYTMSSVLPESSEVGYWLDLAERMVTDDSLGAYFGSDSDDLRAYVRDSMLAYYRG